jgi:glycosyltransferase involved in cell wall biosynthesis
LGIPKDAIVLGTVARLDPIKNHAMMIDAAARLSENHENLLLVIVGDGPERVSLEKRIEEQGMRQHVRITGYRRDARYCYGLMDVFLLTSFSEGTAMTLLEAMAAGLPVVATRVGGNPEIVRDGETGYIIESGDTDSLVDRLNRLIENPAMKSEFGEQGRRRFEARFHVHHMVKGYESLYHLP